MLKREDKDEIIEFLKERLKKIRSLAKFNEIDSEEDISAHFSNITDVVEKSLNEVVW